MKKFFACILAIFLAATITPLSSLESPGKPVPFNLEQAGFQTQALNLRARFSGLGVIPSSIKRGLCTLFQGTEPPRWNRDFARWSITSTLSVASLWTGLHESVSAIPSIAINVGFTSLGTALLLAAGVQAFYLLKRYSHAGSWRHLRATIVIALFVALLSGSSALWYGRHLIRTNFLATLDGALTQAPQVRIDPVSEAMLQKLQLFGEPRQALTAAQEDQLRRYLERFPLDIRHTIIRALARAKEAVSKREFGWQDVATELHEYDGPDNVFSLIEYLETGTVFTYRGVAYAKPRRLPGQITTSAQEAQRLWTLMSGRPYDLAQLIVDAFTAQGLFSKIFNIPGHVEWHVSGLVMNVAKANIPLQMKMRYATYIHNANGLILPRSGRF